MKDAGLIGLAGLSLTLGNVWLAGVFLMIWWAVQ